MRSLIYHFTEQLNEVAAVIFISVSGIVCKLQNDTHDITCTCIIGYHGDESIMTATSSIKSFLCFTLHTNNWNDATKQRHKRNQRGPGSATS